MSDPHESSVPASREEMMSALFANMVLQQANMALMFLGRVPHPQTGQHVVDLETARIFIDQLEMLETKTKGNLDRTEESILKQNLTALRMAFVDAVNQKPGSEPAKPANATAEPAAGSTPAPTDEPAAASPEAESRKKFTKKY